MSNEFYSLEQFLKQYVPFERQEIEAMQMRIEQRFLPRGARFVKAGQYAHEIAFTQSGYLRVFFNHDGNDITRDITPLHSFATALPSFINRVPSYEQIEAITDCELFVINKDDLRFLYDNFPRWERFGRLIMEEMFVSVQDRLYGFITQTAEFRYQEFMKKFPDIIQNVPLQYIASYLGITSQSLSRLRKKSNN